MTPDAAPAGGEPRAAETAAWRVGGPLLLLVLGLPLFFYRLGGYSVVNGDEALYHSVAAHMVATGDWIRIEFAGQHRVYDTFMNAPTQYWARAALIALFGDNLWTMRALAAACGLLSVLATHRLVRWLADGPTALLAGLLQLTTLQFVYLHCARTGELDSAVALLFTLTAYLFLRAVEEGRSFVPHHLCLALLLTLKVPVVAMPLGAELAWLALTPSARGAFRRYALTGLAVVPLGLLWHAVRAGFLWDEFREVVLKMGGEASGAEGTGDRTGGPLSNLAFYGEKLLFGAFPHALALPFALASLLVRRTEPAERRRWLLVLAFAAAVWLFFVLVSKRYPWYVLPSVPFLCAVLASWITRLVRRPAAPAGVAAVAAVVALVLWLRVDLAGFNPFATTASRAPMETAWRAAGGLDPRLGAALSAAVLAGLGLVLARGSAARSRGGGRVLAGVLLAALLALAAARVVLPLRFAGFQSPMARLASRLDADRAAGRPPRYPIPVRESGHFKAKYYFGADHRIVVAGGRDGVHFWLHPLDARPADPPRRR